MKKKIFVFTAFIILFVLSFLDIFKSDREFSNLENRYLKKKPKFTLEKYFNGFFNKEIDEYVNDQFIGRDKFINIKSLAESFLGKIENNEIIYGKDNYMFFKTNKLDNIQIENNLKAINKFFEKNKLNNNFMLVPYSSTIYKEYLPMGTKLIDEEKIIKESYKAINNSKKIELLEALKENKDKYIYYRTDHHWTSYGAYLGYLSYCSENNLEPLKLEQLQENIIIDFLGSYYRRAKKITTEGDKITYYTMDNLTMEIGEEKYSSIYNENEKNNEDKYSIFLKGNNPLTIIKNKDEKIKGKKLVVFKDSFANSFLPFIANNYEETHVIDLRHFNGKIADYIKENAFTDSLVLYSVNSINKDSNIVKIAY